MKRHLTFALAASVLVATTAGCGRTGLPGGAMGQLRDAQPVAGQAIEGKAIVKLRKGQVLRLSQAFAAKAEESVPEIGLYGVDLKGKSIAELKKELGASAEYVDNDRVVTLADPVETLAQTEVPAPAKAEINDPEAAKQWAIGKVQQAEAIAAAKGGSAQVTIAIVDTGVDLKHPDLQDKLVKGYNATGLAGLFGVGKPSDDNGHGTHCAGTAAAITNNGVGVAGMAPNCKIMPVKVLAGPGSGSLLGVAKGIVWAADHGADVISMSLGGAGTTPALGEAVAHAIAKNVVVVAAMGNSGHQGNPVSYPAAYPGVIAVGATDPDDKVTFFSSFNKYCTVSSPGLNIFSCTPTYPVFLNKASGGKITQSYSLMSGTSMATPLVAGLCGLIRSQHPGMAPAQVKEILEKTADKTAGMNGADWDEHYGHGRINALKAVSL